MKRILTGNPKRCAHCDGVVRKRPNESADQFAARKTCSHPCKVARERAKRGAA